MKLVLTLFAFLTINICAQAQIVINSGWPGEEKKQKKEVANLETSKNIDDDGLLPEIENSRTLEKETEPIEAETIKTPLVAETRTTQTGSRQNIDQTDKNETEDELFPQRRTEVPTRVITRAEEKPIKEDPLEIAEALRLQKEAILQQAKLKEKNQRAIAKNSKPITVKKEVLNPKKSSTITEQPKQEKILTRQEKIMLQKKSNPRYVESVAKTDKKVVPTQKVNDKTLTNRDRGYTLEGEDPEDGSYTYRGYTVENGQPEPEYKEPTALLNPVMEDRRMNYYEKNVPITKLIDSIAVWKSERILMTYHKGQKQKKYIICLGMEPSGAKRFEGDMKTPEGLYWINAREHRSRYHKNLNVSYPNNSDRRYASNFGKSAGGEIKIHGFPNGHRQDQEAEMLSKDWTMGCIAVSDHEVTELFYWVKPNCPILIMP